MLQHLRERLVLILLLLLPFHALLVTVGTRLLMGLGHAPLPSLALWKEALLGLVLCVALVEVVRGQRRGHQYTSILITPADVLDWFIVGLFALGLLTTNYRLLTTHSLFGFKYTLFPLLLFLILRRVPWSARFLLLTSYFLLLVGTIVAAYGILTLFLPESFFSWLGYSDLHSLYLPDGPLAAFQKIEGTGIRRIQSTFSGPNQLGMWLLVPWSAALVLLERMKNQELGMRSKEFLLLPSSFLLLFLALFFTFSRSAWMGAAAILLMSVWWSMPQARKFLRYWVLGFLGLCAVGLLVFPGLFLRATSSQEHFRRPLQALRIIAVHPLGLGLGSAGPAANRTGDACVFLEEGADVSWAADRPNLCVFRGDQQVQPFDYAPVQGPSLPLGSEPRGRGQGRGQGKPIPCHCPFLPENWYLQVGVELGWSGLLLYVLLVYFILNSQFFILKWAPSSNFQAALFCSFLGISIAALFLHAWEDSAVAYTVWILLAAVLHPPCRSRHSSLS